MNDLPTTSPTLERVARAGMALHLPTSAYWWLTEGDVVVSRGGRPVEVWTAPRPLDLAGTLREERHARFVAASDVRVVGVAKDALDPVALASALAHESSLLWERIETDARRDDDTFLDGAEPVPGPWTFRRVDATLCVVRGDPARIRGALPPGVRPLPTRGRFLLAITRIEGARSDDPRDTRPFDYHEVTPLVPAWTATLGPAAYVPELYPDAWMATILGREIHGFPKRVARVSVDGSGADLLLERRLALHLRHRSAGACSTGELARELTAALYGAPAIASVVGTATELLDLGARGLMLPVLVRKRIGAPETAGATRAIDALVRVPFHFEPLRSVERLETVASQLGGPGILQGEVVAAFRMLTGLRFGPGATVRRYARGTR